jgi:hypothetical protein
MERWGGLLVLAALAACGDVKVESDAGNGGVDATTSDGNDTDAPVGQPDAAPLPTMAPVSDGQSADLVLGQPSFTPGSGGLSSDQFRYPAGLTSDGTGLWVSDVANSRVMQFNGPPVVNQPNADVVIGQATFNENVDGPTALHLTQPASTISGVNGDVSTDGTVLVVADSHANRVVIWNAIPVANGEPWDIVLGQATPTGSGAGTSATTFNSPTGVWTDGTRIAVADQNNHRVLLWNTFPTANGQAADVALGRGDFNNSDPPASPPTASSMNTPVDVFFDGERLYVSDSRNNRVMGWNGWPTNNNQAADFFVGQSSGATGTANAGAGTQEPNAIGLSSPGQITVAHGSLYVVDAVNFRVVVHTPRPTASGTAAKAVLGASSLTSTAFAQMSDDAFTPRGLAVLGDKLFLSDSNVAFGYARVLRYSLSNLP